MGLYRRIAQMLVVTIALIAAGLSPSAVEAHAGHRHAPHAAHVEIGAAPAMVEARVAGCRASTPGDVLIGVSTLGPADAGASDSNRPCTGFCCGSGTACCASAIAPEAVGIPPPRAGGLRVDAGAAAARASVDPERLPKPPRPLA